MLEFAIEFQVLSYNEAWLYCVTCTHNNKYDWRYPTIGDVSVYPNILKYSFSQPSEWFYVTPVRTI
jgi:hypothetical protein